MPLGSRQVTAPTEALVEPMALCFCPAVPTTSLDPEGCSHAGSGEPSRFGRKGRVTLEGSRSSAECLLRFPHLHPAWSSSTGGCSAQ